MKGSMFIAAGLLALAGCHQGAKTQPAPAASKAGEEGWRDTFTVQKADLDPTGKSTYFDLTPGVSRVYREGKEQLTVTVLDETKVIDGVTTRVVEEREEAGGSPKEVSRNYFAIDRRTGDVYYFGEDVDVYKGGKVASHPGGWHSGLQGARFGLFIPSAPKAGDRFYQEVAPKVAMDRVEVVSGSETVQTPAGEFKNCIHLRETTPLEADVGHKWFAPGIGLVKDGDLVLVSGSPPPK
jgi:hypothetical protein